MPAIAVQCLSHIIEGDTEGWAIYGWREEARTVLENAVKSDDGAARKAADELINRLGARGHLEFRDLLSGA